MAKVKFSALVSDMRNKLNGSVFSKNRYGSYLRNKITPVNPQSSYQLAQRANLSFLSSAWRTLTDQQREGWRTLAQTSPSTDIFGDSKILAGNAYFVALNLNLLGADSPIALTAPILVSVPVVVATNVALDANQQSNNDISLTIDPATIPAGFKLAVYATPSMSPGITFVKNKLRYLGVFPATSGTVNLLTRYTERFGLMTFGERVFFRLALVSNSSGQLGLPSAIDGIVVSDQ